MAGYVKVPDSVRHKTEPAGAKAVVVWVPGDEGKKIAGAGSAKPSELSSASVLPQRWSASSGATELSGCGSWLCGRPSRTNECGWGG